MKRHSSSFHRGGGNGSYSACHPFFPAAPPERGGWKGSYGKRTSRKPARLHSAVGRLRHRHRQCLEIPMACRSERWRRLRHHLSDLSCPHGRAGHDDGIRHGARRTEKSRPDVLSSGARRHEVAYPRICRLRRQLHPHDVLHLRLRLDAPVLCLYSRWYVLRP